MPTRYHMISKTPTLETLEQLSKRSPMAVLAVARLLIQALALAFGLFLVINWVAASILSQAWFRAVVRCAKAGWSSSLHDSGHVLLYVPHRVLAVNSRLQFVAPGLQCSVRFLPTGGERSRDHE